MNKITRIGLFLLFSLLYLPATATTKPRYFAVELVLFENLSSSARESERWPQSVELDLPPESTIEIGKPYPGPLPKGFIPSYAFKPLRAGEYRLKSQVEKINKSESRRVLLHTGWRQPGLDIDSALSVHFKRQISAPTTASNTQEADAEESNDAETQQTRFVTPESGELEGIVKVILARYLRVDVDIVFRPHTSDMPEDIFQISEFDQADTSVAKPRVYRMHQTRRRIRSRELHYLDNPVIGMLVLITPFESRSK